MITSRLRVRLIEASIIVTLVSAFPCALAAHQDDLNPHPVNSAELLTAVGRADKIVVYNFSIDGGPKNRDILFSSRKPSDIAELRRSLVIEPPAGWYRCACLPTLEIELSRQGKSIGVISFFEELSLEFSGWTADAHVADTERLLQWFDARGIKRPRQMVDADASERWFAAMPSSVRPLWQNVEQDPLWYSRPDEAPKSAAKLLASPLANEFPDPNQRIRALFSWFGCMGGPWSGYYAWEDVPARMLLEYPASQLIPALQGAPLTDNEAEGAARFFAGYTYNALVRPSEDRTLINQLPDELKKTISAHVLKTGDEDKITRFNNAFQMSVRAAPR
jgi:hypothetical protein